MQRRWERAVEEKRTDKSYTNWWRGEGDVGEPTRARYASSDAGSSSSQGKTAMDDPDYTLWKKLKAAETGMIVQERVEGLDSGKQISINRQQRPGGSEGTAKIFEVDVVGEKWRIRGEGSRKDSRV